MLLPAIARRLWQFAAFSSIFRCPRVWPIKAIGQELKNAWATKKHDASVGLIHLQRSTAGARGNFSLAFATPALRRVKRLHFAAAGGSFEMY
jgi:hypothetical protein